MSTKKLQLHQEQHIKAPKLRKPRKIQPILIPRKYCQPGRKLSLEPSLGGSPGPRATNGPKKQFKITKNCSRLTKSLKPDHHTTEGREGSGGRFRISGAILNSKQADSGEIRLRRSISRKQAFRGIRMGRSLLRAHTLQAVSTKVEKGTPKGSKKSQKCSEMNQTVQTIFSILDRIQLIEEIESCPTPQNHLKDSKECFKNPKNPKKSKQRHRSTFFQKWGSDVHKRPLLLSPTKSRHRIDLKTRSYLTKGSITLDGPNHPSERRFTTLGETGSFGVIRRNHKPLTTIFQKTETTKAPKKSKKTSCAFFEENNIKSDSRRVVVESLSYASDSSCLSEEDEGADDDSEDSVSKIEILVDEDYLTNKRGKGAKRKSC